ncbi:DUF4290 domain-containing protein [Blattabacterium cuenoti]|uniref:DUF4290 domain-containing protein n=1 Tax=Blattabacterium cuenoti TaxID=1653831 RepID=UPI00163C6293|nr:DUF4290 domain-containing protein [Blattabacterium cuenoti]
MEYNTSRFQLIIPEYGRNIHKMIAYAIKIKDRKKRNRCAWSIIRLMIVSNTHHYGGGNNGNNGGKIIPFYQHKLWNQLLIMSNYKLDIDSPFPKPNSDKQIKIFCKKVIYPEYLTSFRYYGKIIRYMIPIAIKCKNQYKQEGLFYAIANTMKKNYLRWNRTLVEDHVIFKDLKQLSKGKICLMNNTYPLLQCSYLLNQRKNKNFLKIKKRIT